MDNFIKQPYHITLSENKFNIHEQRLLLRIMENLQGSFFWGKTPLQVYDIIPAAPTVIKIRIKDLLIKGSKNYSAVRRALDCLLTKQIIMRGGGSNPYIIKSHLISEYKYNLNNQWVEIVLGRSILAYLRSLTNYTRYSFQIAFNVMSPYTCRLYQYISHWRDKKNGFEFKLKTKIIREMFGLGSKYKRANGIKQFILDPAQKELKAKGDIWFEIKESIKEGRQVVGWVIKIFKSASPNNRALPMIEAKKKLSEKQKKILLRLQVEFKQSDQQARDIVEKYDEKEINQTLYEIAVAISDKKVYNIGAYTAKVFASKLNQR